MVNRFKKLPSNPIFSLRIFTSILANGICQPPIYLTDSNCGKGTPVSRLDKRIIGGENITKGYFGWTVANFNII